MKGESIALPPADGALARLVELMIDGTIAPADRDRLELLLAEDPAAQLFYVACLDLHAQVQWLMRDGGTAEAAVAEAAVAEAAAERHSERSEESGLTAEGGQILRCAQNDGRCAQNDGRWAENDGRGAEGGSVPAAPPVTWGLGWLSSGVLLSYAICAVLIGAGAMAAWHWSPPAFGPRVAKNFSRAPVMAPVGIAPPIVATITRSVGCDWTDPNLGREGTQISLGSCYYVASGRLEISYNMGAKVVIEGPAMFAVDALNGGFLKLGNLLVEVAPGRRDARAQRWERFFKGGRARLSVDSDLPAALADEPAFCIRFPRDATHCHTIMSDRGAAFALSRGTDGSLVGYILKSPVWVSGAEFEFSTPRFLQEGASVLAGAQKNGASRLAVGQNKPPAAFLRGLLEGKSIDLGPNRGPRGS